MIKMLEISGLFLCALGADYARKKTREVFEPERYKKKNKKKTKKKNKKKSK